MDTTGNPFIGTEAVAAGRFTRRTLASRNTLIYRNVYLPADAELTPVDRAVAAWLWSGGMRRWPGARLRPCTEAAG